MKHEGNAPLICPLAPFQELSKKNSSFISSRVAKLLPPSSGTEHRLFEMIDVCKTDHGTFTLPFIKIGKFTMHPMCKILHQGLNQCN